MKDLTDTRIFYINLDNRPDRRKIFESQFALSSMPPVQRIPAIQGMSVDVKNNKNIGMNTRVQVITEFRRSHYEIHSRGAIGASLSHLKTWKAFLKTDAKYALILEDDAKLPATFSMMLKDCAINLPSKWDVWILGWTNNPIDVAEDINPFKRILHFIGAHCYIITRKAAKIFIDNFFPIESHIEHYMNNVALINNLIILRNIRLHVPQFDRKILVSDIRKPIGCPTCNVDDKEEAMEARRKNL